MFRINCIKEIILYKEWIKKKLGLFHIFAASISLIHFQKALNDYILSIIGCVSIDSKTLIVTLSTSRSFYSVFRDGHRYKVYVCEATIEDAILMFRNQRQTSIMLGVLSWP